MNPSANTWKDARRLHAWQLKQTGGLQRQIADALGVSEAAVSQWIKRAREGGSDALRHRASPGALRRLSAAPLRIFIDMKEHAGVWRGNFADTCKRMTNMLRLICK
jgi:transposase